MRPPGPWSRAGGQAAGGRPGGGGNRRVRLGQKVCQEAHQTSLDPTTGDAHQFTPARSGVGMSLQTYPAPTVRLRDLHPTLRLRLGTAFIERTMATMAVPVMAVYLSAAVGAGTAGLLIVVSVAVAAAAGLSSGHFADVLGRRRALLVGAVAMTAGFGGMAIAASPLWSSPIAVFLFYTLQAAAASFIQPVHEAIIIDVTVPAQRKVVYTINYWSFNIAWGAGALLAVFL